MNNPRFPLSVSRKMTLLAPLGAWVSFAAALPLFAAAQPTPIPPQELEFFEKSVRPLLETHCIECHSAAKGKTKGGLALDSAAALHKGGTSGQVIHPGAPDKSLFIKAIRYKDEDLQMPPDGKKLAPEQIAILEQWIQRGAHDPREGKALGPDPEAARKHWAYLPVQKPTVPPVKQASWPRTEIDRFVLSALESKGILPSAEADRRTLLRRLSYDLLGLPPSLAEVRAFESDPAPDAYEKAVDRLLASPHFGERWGRYWLDVARYSDTKGLPAPIGADRRFHFAYSYRDYVIAAFNEDKPFNQFILEQLAADFLAPAPNDPSLAALGFLTVGRCFQNQIHEIIDDRIDVVTRGLMGISVGCARCHDHKFDPISTKDYYALHGVFMSSEEPKEKPILGIPSETPEYTAYLQKRNALLQKVDEGIVEEIRKDLADVVAKSQDYLLASQEKAAAVPVKELQTFAGERKLVPLPLSRWVKLLHAPEPHPVLTPWRELRSVPAAEFKQTAQERIRLWTADPAPHVNPLLLQALQAAPPDSLAALAQVYSKLFQETHKAWEDSLQTAAKQSPQTPPSSLPDPARESIRQLLCSEGAPAHMTRAEAESVFARKLVDVRAKLNDEVLALDGKDPASPARAMVLLDKPSPVEPVVFIRGNPGNRGPKVPRQFISFLSGDQPKPFTRGSGRLELAQAIADPSNPLTSRVAVNRIWLHLFGRGLVSTPNDFGVQTPAPSLPILLDHLASRFVENGWSTKKLIREIVLSSVYRQSSAPRPDAAAADPGNELLHAQRRRRLDYEALQDTLNAVSGSLDPTFGGKAIELTKAPFPGRRSVYGYIDRQDLPSVLRNFDFANPDITTGQRFETAVPQQALFLMNSDLIQSRAKALAAHPEITQAAPGDARVQALFARVYQRQASPVELDATRQFLDQYGGKPDQPWLALAQVLLLSNETMFLD
jgi:mono/diheme cytochrome c family protein